MLHFSVKTVLMDIDGTMTSTDGHYSDGMEKGPLIHLEDILMAKNGIPRGEAKRRILACGDISVHCLSEFLGQLGVLPAEYFDAMREDLKRHTIIPEDVVAFLRAMKERGIPVYTATTNSRFMTLVKLSTGGIADIRGCGYLSGYYAGCTFLDPEGKFSRNFYPNILRDGRFDPEHVMMIGDDPVRDMLPAMKAGIKYGVNVDRRQKESIVHRDGGISVNSLEVLIGMIVEGERCYA